MSAVYTPGERAVQERADVLVAAARSARGIRSDIPEVAAAFLAERPFVVVGAGDAEGRVWASLVSGSPGFARAVDEHTVDLSAPIAADDPLADLADGSFIGLLALDPATRRRMRVNGRVRRRRGGLEVEVDQVVSNCPKYITERHRRVQDHSAPPRRRTGGPLELEQRDHVAAADTFFIASATDDGADASHRGGNPGFIDVRDDRHLSWPDYAGNAMFLTLGNLESNPRAGLLFVDWEVGRTLQITGTAAVDWDPDAAARSRGAERTITFEIERWVEVQGASSTSWELGSLSRFNPTAPRHQPVADLHAR